MSRADARAVLVAAGDGAAAVAAVALGVRLVHERPVQRDLAVRAAVEHGVADAVRPPAGADTAGNIWLCGVREIAALQVEACVADAHDLISALRRSSDMIIFFLKPPSMQYDTRGSLIT